MLRHSTHTKTLAFHGADIMTDTVNEFDTNNEGPEILSFTVPDEMGGNRMDKVLASLCKERSRSYLKGLIEGGKVCVDGVSSTSPSNKMPAGAEISLELPPPENTHIEAENIPLDIVFEDEELLVINKPAGMVVHPGAGNKNHTLVNALLYYCEGQLSGIGGVARPGIVHRLDKETTGLMIAAKTDRAHQALAAQLADRTLGRKYLAIATSVPVPLVGNINLSIGRNRTNRQKMAVVKGGKNAVTNYRVLKKNGDFFSLVECKLETGRTHQIRVHMDAMKHPLVGDPLYRPQATALESLMNKAGFEEEQKDLIRGFGRQALHAAEIDFIHPVSEEEMKFSIPMPEDLEELAGIMSLDN